MKTTQEILHTFFTEVEGLTPVDYNLYVQRKKDKGMLMSDESNFPTLPEGTVIVATGLSYEEQDLLVVRYLDGTYRLVDEFLGLEDFSKTPEVDPKASISELYEIEHYGDDSTHYHYTSYTSRTGALIYSIIYQDNFYLGGIMPVNAHGTWFADCVVK